MTTKILHTADTHLGYTQYYSPVREQDFLDAFAQVVDIAIEEDVDAVVHGGDGFHSSRPDFGALSGAMEQLNRLDEHKIQFLTVLGNHDSGGQSKWLDLFEIVERAEHLTYEPTLVNDEVAVYGIDYMSEAERSYSDITFVPGSSTSNILVSHGEFYPFVPGGWDLNKLMAQSNIEFDAILLGDQHEYMYQMVSGVPATYAGSTERTAHDQETERRVNIVEIDGDDVTIRERMLDVRDFVVETISVTESDITQTVIDKALNLDYDDSVVHLTLEGNGGYIDVQEVENALKKNADVIYVSVQDTRDTVGASESIDVNFSDPTSVIDSHVDDIGLSSVGETLDTIVRKSSTPKTRIKENVDESVSDIVDESPERFLPTDSDTGINDAYRSTLLEVATHSWAPELFEHIENGKVLVVDEFAEEHNADEDVVKEVAEMLHENNILYRDIVSDGLFVTVQYKPGDFLIDVQKALSGG